MCSSVAKHLSDFRPDEFDYIVIDEAHRTGSQGYQSIMSHFTPRFYLGMTATPNRTDGYDVFALSITSSRSRSRYRTLWPRKC